MRAWLVFPLLVGFACSDDAPARRSADASVGSAEAAVLPYASCAALAGTAPAHIRDVLEHINQLPEPSIACLVASMPRPVRLVASLGVSSLQPASGYNSPRLFLLYPNLSLSVVAQGDGKDRVEFGEWVTPTRTLKAELIYPLGGPASEAAAYGHLKPASGGASACGLCHINEVPHPTIPDAFVSNALQPARINDLALPDVRAILDECNAAAQPGPHCPLLHAVFDYGEVRQGAFSDLVQDGF